MQHSVTLTRPVTVPLVYTQVVPAQSPQSPPVSSSVSQPPPSAISVPWSAPILITPMSILPPYPPVNDAYVDAVLSVPGSVPVDGGIMPSSTYAGLLSQPFFETAGAAPPVGVDQWATFPAVAAVEMDLFPVLNAQSYSTATPQNVGDQMTRVNPTGVFTFVGTGGGGVESTGFLEFGTDGSMQLLSALGGPVFGGLTLDPVGNATATESITAPLYKVPLAGLQSAPIRFTDLSGNHDLRSIAGDLYFDAELLAKANDIQNVADWALYPALAAVNIDGFPVSNVQSLELDTSGGASVTLTTDASGHVLANAVPLATETFATAAATAAAAQWATHFATATVDLSGQTLSNAASVGIGAAGANGLLTTASAGTVLQFNGATISTGTGGNVSQWATFPAVSAVDMALNNLNFVGDITCRNLDVGDAGTGLGDLNLYGASNLVLDNALYVEGGVSMSAAGNVHAIHLGTNTVAGIDTCRLDLTAVGVIAAVAPGAITINAGGAANIAAGGAVSIAGGGYIEMNSGEVRVINSTTPANAKLVFPAAGGSIEFQGAGGGEITGLEFLTSPTSILVSASLDFNSNPTKVITGLQECNTVITTADQLGSTFNPAILLTANIADQVASPNTITVGTLESRGNVNLLGLTPSIVATDPSPIAITLQATSGVEIKNNAGNFGRVRHGVMDLYSSSAPTLFTELDVNTANTRIVAVNVAGTNTLAYQSDLLVYQAQYYKTVGQSLTSGNTDITFDGLQTWVRTGGYITHTPGTTVFTVVQAGIYQLEFNAVVVVGASVLSATTNRNIGIDITRSPGAEINILQSTVFTAVGQSFILSAAGTTFLAAGDVINLRIGVTFAGAAPTAQAQVGIDPNTFFNWTYISPAGPGV